MLNPLFDFVIMERDQLKAPKGVLLPDSAMQRNAPCKGTCIAIGPDASQIEVGKSYLWGAHGGSWLREDGTPATDVTESTYFVLQDTQVLAEVT